MRTTSVKHEKFAYLREMILARAPAWCQIPATELTNSEKGKLSDSPGRGDLCNEGFPCTLSPRTRFARGVQRGLKIRTVIALEPDPSRR